MLCLETHDMLILILATVIVVIDAVLMMMVGRAWQRQGSTLHALLVAGFLVVVMWLLSTCSCPHRSKWKIPIRAIMGTILRATKRTSMAGTTMRATTG